MRTLKPFLVIALCVALYAPLASAQDQPRDANGNARVAQDVTIIIQPQQVRFIAQKAGDEMHLQVFDQTGAVVYDSGAIFNTELIWPLQNASGATLKSGLYAYALSMKETGKEPGAEKARMRRGHFIVDRAQDRDGVADKLWVTSTGAGDVGAELTLAKDENVVIAGTATRRDNPSGGDLPTRASEIKQGEEKQKDDAKSQKSEAAAPAATVGQIAKFTTATVVGDSVMTEANGSIGIGTTPLAGVKLDVSGGMHLTVAPNTNNNGEIFFGTPSTEVGMTIHRDMKRADIRFDGSTLKLLARGLEGSGPPASESGIAINTLGNVGIGTTTPLAGIKLDVVGAARISTANGMVNFGSPNGETGMSVVTPQLRADLRLDNSALKLVAGPAGGPAPATNGIAINVAGNVGIGTVTPASKLHVEGTGFVVTTVKSSNQTAILSLDSRATGNQQIWNLESGIFGNTNMFGIYDRTAQKARLTIDKAGLVAVTTLRIDGGADLAENFDVQATNASTGAGAAEIRPGMVVAIDPLNPGKLNLSQRAYDRRVAGIISGAGDVKPGMMMGQAGTLADGKHPVALTGRVYCWVDAARGAVRPGDLLTTSATPGHAMKAGNSAKAPGAIIGKAMTGLKAGKGLVLVLVTLQ